MTGSSSFYPGTVFAARGDVILVVVNYRLNVLDILTTHDSTLPANLGLWDQHLALQWVRDNIDQSGVTLFGGSAGGSSVVYQMFSPLNSQELFQRVISQSANAVALSVVNRNTIEVNRLLGAEVNCSVNHQFADCLRGKSAQELVKATTIPPSHRRRGIPPV